MRPVTASSLFVLSLAGLLVLGGCAARSASPPPVLLNGGTMGTTYEIRLTELPEGTSAEELQAEIDRRLEVVNDQMSTWRPESELSRFNRHDRTDWFDVSPELAAVVAESLRVSRMTDGAFDVTVGPLVNLWSFGPAERSGRAPSEAEIAEKLEAVGWQQLEVRRSPPALRKARGDLYVDLSGIAKGYGVDVVAEYLDRLDTGGYMVEIGGEVRTGGTKGDGSPWRIGIETPDESAPLDHRRIFRAVPLTGRAMATSGDYRNVFEQQGERFSHTIDPRTGRPARHDLASVSIVADNCMFADAMATALMVLGPEEAYNTATEQDVAALLIVRAEQGFIERKTPAFEELFKSTRGRP